MTDAAQIVTRALDRLGAAQSPLREELVAQVVDYVLGQRLCDVIDLERARAVVLCTLGQEHVKRAVERHVRPGFERYARAIADSEARVGDLVAPSTRARLHAIARKLRLPRAHWSKGMVDPVLVRRLLSPVWTQVLLNFATRLPIPGISGFGGGGDSGERSGVTGFIARSVQGGAGKLIDRGRSVIGGLGAEVEKRLLEAARGFSDNAAEIFRQALRERIASDEGRVLMDQITASVVERVLEARFCELQQDVDALPLGDVFDVTPEVVAHAAPTAYVQDIVQRELAAYLASDGERTLRELLEELGVFADVRAELLGTGKALTGRFFESPAFADWLTRLVAD